MAPRDDRSGSRLLLPRLGQLLNPRRSAEPTLAGDSPLAMRPLAPAGPLRPDRLAGRHVLVVAAAPRTGWDPWAPSAAAVQAEVTQLGGTAAVVTAPPGSPTTSPRLGAELRAMGSVLRTHIELAPDVVVALGPGIGSTAAALRIADSHGSSLVVLLAGTDVREVLPARTSTERRVGSRRLFRLESRPLLQSDAVLVFSDDVHDALRAMGIPAWRAIRSRGRGAADWRRELPALLDAIVPESPPPQRWA